MVNKMKAFSIIFILALIASGNAGAQAKPQFQEVVYYEQPVNYHPMAQAAQPKRSPIEQIIWNNKVRCGSNMAVKSYAYQEDGYWYGVDADFCRVIAEALLGDNKKIEMVNVTPKKMSKALDENKIDVMLSGAAYSARTETAREGLSAGLLYYDHQMVMVREDSSDVLEDYRGKKICLSTDTDYYKNFDDYNTKYNLGIKFLTFNTLEQAKEAFFLKRCDMLTAGGLILNGLKKELPATKVKILPQQIALQPVYAFVQRDNAELRLALKWVFNALFLAEQYGVNARNLNFYAGSDNIELQNLLGENPELWMDLKVKPRWLKKSVAAVGSYQDIYDKNLGMNSDFKLDRKEGRLVKDGGTIYPIPFM